MVAKKRKSKRVSLQQKYKMQKRTKEHHKRLKKGRLEGNFKGKKEDNFIPNAWPYKEDLLKEIKGAQERMEAMKQRQKEKRMEDMMAKRGLSTSSSSKTDVSSSKTVSISKASNSSSTEPVERDDIDIKTPSLGQNSRRAYLRELRKVVETADVILMILDGRDPIGTRSTAVEDMVLSDHRKKLVYVLNKSDLVPRDVLAGWLAYLRKSHPTVPFKCNTQSQKGNLGRASGKVVKQIEGGLQTSQAVGAEELIGLLKNYCRVGDSKSIISVGIVGFPNVGKSSLINSMMRTRAVGVSSMPGFTKVLQEVNLDKNIRLIDSPGIVFADGDSTATALRNCVNVEEMDDVITPVQAILDRCPQQYLMQLYSIPKFKSKDCMSFLALVARTSGKLKKGGIPNIDSAARSVIHDWNSGKIKFYCKPPAVVQPNGAMEVDTKILNEFSEELDLSAMDQGDIRVLDAIEALRSGDNSYIGMDEIAGKIDFYIGDGSDKAAPIIDIDGMVLEKDTSSDVEDDGEATVASARRKSTGSGGSKKSGTSSFLPDEVAPDLDPRKLQKKLKKKTGKDTRRGEKSDGATSNEDYSFEADFKY